VAMSITKFLPYVFTISGFGMVCNINNPISYFSGLLLMFIACLIWIRQLERQGPSKPMKELRHNEGPGHNANGKWLSIIR
jgi:hypothetical protein